MNGGPSTETWASWQQTLWVRVGAAFQMLKLLKVKLWKLLNGPEGPGGALLKRR